jgi:hypothetical protein
MKELDMYLAVSDCRSRVSAGEPIERAALAAASKYMVDGLTVLGKAQEAIKALTEHQRAMNKQAEQEKAASVVKPEPAITHPSELFVEFYD